MATPLNIHKAYCAASYDGAFFPNTFLLFLDFPEKSLWGERAAYRTLWHEYMHFLQCTTTTHGINVFIREYQLAALTLKCIYDLRDISSEIMLPLSEWSKQTNSKSVKEILDKYIEYRTFFEEDLATLQGLCKYDDTEGKIVHNGKPVFNQAGCPLQNYYDDPRVNTLVPIGSRAIMEGAASTIEYLYLWSLGTLGNDVECLSLAEEWRRTREPDPAYYATIDLFAQRLKDESHYSILAKLIALSDLALCPPIEVAPLSCKDDEQRYPGRRLLAALSVASRMSPIKPFEFHDNYKEFIFNICTELNWIPPWEMVTDSLIHYVTSDYLYTKDSPFCDLIGPALVLLNGLNLRKRYSMYCANPIPNIAEAQRLSKKKEFKNEHVIVHWEMILAAHTPPFVRHQDGSRSFSDSAKKTMAGQIDMNEDELLKVVENSFNDYYYLQMLSQTVWHGRNVSNSIIDCLRFDTDGEHANCKGYLLGFENSATCYCKDVFKKHIGCYPNEVKWLR